jgi:hypothetical protein
MEVVGCIWPRLKKIGLQPTPQSKKVDADSFNFGEEAGVERLASELTWLRQRL